MSKKSCTFEGCQNLHYGKGFCQKHFDSQKPKYTKSPEQRKRDAQREKERMAKDPNYKEARDKQRKLSYRKAREDNLEREQAKEKERASKPKAKFGKGKINAKKRGIDWEITLEDYNSIITNKTECFYACGNPLPERGCGLDRIDNKKGYTLDNVIPCCTFCNLKKGTNLTHIEMTEIVKLLKNMRGVDNIWENCDSIKEVSNKRKICIY